MKLFSRKKKISSVVMMHLVYETGKSQVSSIFGLFDKVGIVYDEVEAQINIRIINYELCRYALYIDNKSKEVEGVLDKVYEQLFYDTKLSSELSKEYKSLIDVYRDKLKTIYNTKKISTSREDLIYHLLLQQISVNEQIIENMYIPEFIAIIKLWINNAEGIRKAYLIENSEEEKKKNEYIDFRF